MEFMHIAPSQYLHELNGRMNLFDGRKGHLTLAHLVETDKVYTSFYNSQVERDPLNGTTTRFDFDGKIVYDSYGSKRRTDFAPINTYSNKPTIIMDNAGFENYQLGLPMFPGNKLVDLGKKIGADYIVMPDYPGENQWKTIAAARKYAPQFREAGFGTFFVPQSEIGDIEGYIEAFAFAATSPLVDYIGVSILGVPNAFGVYGNQLQQYLSRREMMKKLFGHGLLQCARASGKRIHFLGMLDGPKEITEVAPFVNYIDTWDSSAGTHCGINDIRFDKSPTGLVNGKVKSHVDFNAKFDESKIDAIAFNIKVIDDLVAEINKQADDESKRK